MKNKEKLAEEKASILLKPIGLISLLAFVTLFASPIIWIWFSGFLALKIALTSIVCIFSCGLLSKVIMAISIKIVEERFKHLEDV